MTGNKLLLDTNIIIELFKGDMEISALLDAQEKVYIPVTVLGELYLGAYRSSDLQKKLQQISVFLLRCIILNVDTVTAETYAIIKTGLLNKGKPIPENDIWIAALAVQYKMRLYTNDGHFKEIDGIDLT